MAELKEINLSFNKIKELDIAKLLGRNRLGVINILDISYNKNLRQLTLCHDNTYIKQLILQHTGLRSFDNIINFNQNKAVLKLLNIRNTKIPIPNINNIKGIFPSLTFLEANHIGQNDIRVLISQNPASINLEEDGKYSIKIPMTEKCKINKEQIT